MTPDEVEDLLGVMRRAGSDTTSIEVKRAKSELPGRLWETLSAFANSRGGGVLMLGVNEQQDFAASGVSEPGKIQADLASVCGRMIPPIRSEIDAVEVGGRMVIICQVPEVPRDEKPCYYGPSGVSTGSYIRVGDGDRRLTQYEIQILLSERRQPAHDAEIVPGASVHDLHPELVAGLVARLRLARPRSFGELGEVQILTRVNALRHTDEAVAVPTVAGLLALGSYPQQYFPQLNVTFVVYPDVRKGQPGPSGERFLDNEAIDGSIPAMVVRSLAAIRRNMKRRSVVSGAGRRDIWEYPETALREALVNAIVHRDLSPLARGNPVQVEMYPDRVEIRNPGGLYGPISIEDLLSGGSLSSSRNPILLRLLEDTEMPGEGATVCENRGSGIPAMIASLREAGLGLPILEDRLSHFSVEFPNHTLLDPEVLAWIETLQHENLSDAQVMGLARMYRGEVLSNSTYRAPLAQDSRVAGQELKDLVARGLVDQHGTRGTATYELASGARASHGAGSATWSASSRRDQVRQALLSGPMTRQELQEVMGLQPAAVLRYLRQLKESGEVEQIGAARSPKTQWRLVRREPSLFDD